MEFTQLYSRNLAKLKEDVSSLHTLMKSQLDPLKLTTRLYDATIKGDLNSLHDLHEEDPFILDRCIIERSDRFMQSPLHVAASLGHLEFTTEILRLQPKLAKQLDQSTRSSALHLASEEGHLDVVKKLIEVNPNMCFARDQDGRNPIHVAAINNQLDVLDFLVGMNPFAAQERTSLGETILHLCVKYAKLETLKHSVNAMVELLRAEDNDGNTVLHLAVLAKQPEVVKFLVANKEIQQNRINKNGLTAIDILLQAGKINVKEGEIFQALKRAKAIKAKLVNKKRDKDGKWLNEKRNTLMVVASLLATMAFQVGVNPPAVVGQDNSNTIIQQSEVISPAPISYGVTDLVGELILPCVNTISFVSSLNVVFLLISGLPCKRLFVILLMISMWVSIAATLLTYFFSSRYFSFISDPSEMIGEALVFVSYVWAYLVGLFVIALIIRFLIKPVAKILGQLVKRMMRKWMRGRRHSSSIVNP